MVSLKFQLNDSLYIKDPQDTELGKKIIKHSILLIEEIGFEAFTFKKLARRIKSTEASIYRYFDNKHYLLLYLTSWYWEWVRYLIDINTRNITDAVTKLKIAVETIVHASDENPCTPYVNERILHHIIINESSKAYHTNAVDFENSAGLFLSYKQVVGVVAEIIKEVDPKFPYTKTLASNLFEMSNNQIYFVQHMPGLTDLKDRKGNFDELNDLLQYFTFKLLNQPS